MSIETLSKMAIAYSNNVGLGLANGVQSTGVTAFQAGFPLSNLLFESPWDVIKTNGVSGTVTLELQFSTSVSVQAYGLLNHNLKSAGYSQADFQWWNGSSYVSQAIVNLTPNNPDVLVTTTTLQSATKFRVSFGSASGDFRLGSFFVGLRRVMDRNPAAEGIIQRRTPPILIENAAGGALHVIKGADKRDAEMEITWTRCTIDDVEFLKQQDEYSLLGIVSPEQGDNQATSFGQDCFFGYVTSSTMSPRGPGGQLTTQPARYDWTLTLQGAV